MATLRCGCYQHHLHDIVASYMTSLCFGGSQSVKYDAVVIITVILIIIIIISLLSHIQMAMVML